MRGALEPAERGPAPTGSVDPLSRIAVITDIHGNLPALEASRSAIDAIGLVGVRPVADEIPTAVDRVHNDAHAVVREVAAAGQPGEYADKLVTAA